MKKNAGIFTQLLTGALFIMLFGCNKGIIENQADTFGPEKQGSALTSLNLTPNIYVTGSLNGQAVYWLNGTAVTLPGGAMATGIVVVGTDVHVCGYGISSTTGEIVAKYWLNGVLTDLSDGTSEVTTTGIGISGTDVYIAGYEGRYVTTACFWKNGVRTNLPSGSMGITGEVFVSTGGNVYIPNRNSYTYWKDGVLQPALGLPAGPNAPYVDAVKEFNGVVYAVGTVSAGAAGTPLFWINGVLQTGYLGNPNGYAEANDIVVSATGQRYFAGLGGTSWSSPRIMYWDNVGAADYWSTNTAYSQAKITLDGLSDVYVCGSDTRAMYWHNSAFDVTYLTDGTVPAVTTDIVVVP